MIAVSGGAHTIAELSRAEGDAYVVYRCLLLGYATWRDVSPEYTCGDRQNVAIDEAFQQWQEAKADYDRALNGGDSNAA